MWMEVITIVVTVAADFIIPHKKSLYQVYFLTNQATDFGLEKCISSHILM